MKLKTVFLAGASVLAMTAHAYAFTAIGSAVISALYSIGLGALLPAASAAAIGSAALSIGLGAASLASRFIGRGGAQRSTADPNNLRQTSRGAEGPGRYAFGRVELAGKVAFGGTSGYYISRLLLHCFGPINAIEEYFYDGQTIVVESDGTVSSPPWATPAGGYLNIQTKVGNGAETAWGSLITDFPTRWTSAHKAAGIGQSLIRAQNPGTASDLFPILFQGGIKELRVRAQVGKFYDPRDTSTIWNLNGALICLHWLRQLPFVADDILDFDDIETVATQAEASVATLTGTAPRSQLSGGWEGPLSTDIVEDMLESAGLDLRLSDVEDKYTLEFIDDAPDAEITLYNRHIIDRSIQAGPDGAKRPNICRVSYFSPERRYEVAELDLTGAGWARIEDEIAAYGDQEMEIRLPFCCNASQAQRIARRIFHMARADSGIITTTFAGMACWGVRTASIEFPDLGSDGESIFLRCRLGPLRPDDDNGTCEIPFQVIPDILFTAWNKDIDEVAAPPVLEAQEFESSLTTPSAPSAVYLVQYPSTAYEIRLVYTLPGGGSTTEALMRVYSSGVAGAPVSMNEQTAPSTFAFYTGGSPGQELDFRVRIFNADGEASHLSPALYVPSLAVNNSPPAAPTATLGPVLDGGNLSQVVMTDIRCADTSWNASYIEVKRRIDTGSGYGPFVGIHSANIRPGVSIDYTYDLSPDLTPGQKINIQIIVHTSNGTGGTPLNWELTVPS